MIEDQLTKVGVSILGVRDRGPILDAFAKEGCFPEPGAVWLLCGKSKVEAVLGSGWINEITALRKFGTDKAQRRASWEPYCVWANDRWNVTCIHPDAVRRSGWVKKPNLTAAVRWAIHLAKGGTPFTTITRVRPKEWS